jgi:DNA-directed RNA polymerase subunit M/transcription elongation factor TFIIS
LRIMKLVFKETEFKCPECDFVLEQPVDEDGDEKLKLTCNKCPRVYDLRYESGYEGEQKFVDIIAVEEETGKSYKLKRVYDNKSN